VVLVSRQPLATIERVAVGEYCRTAVAALRIALAERHGKALLEVENKGPRLPEEMRGRLFASMVSVRGKGAATGAPHLGLGLYVARLIAEFHGGGIQAENTAAADGVTIRVTVPIVPR